MYSVMIIPSRIGYYEERKEKDAMASPGQAGNEEMAPDPRGKLMQEVAQQMDAIEADFGEDFRIGRVITIVEVQRPTEAGQAQVDLRVRANMFPWVALGMLQAAADVVKGRPSN
jgi:hypothetical protein